MTETEIAWLAGWLEGEGYFGVAPSGSIVIQVCCTDQDVMEKAAKLMRAKGVKLQKRKKEHWKDVYKAHLHGQSAVNIMKLIRPYMGERRGAVIDTAIEYFNGKDERRRKARTGLKFKSSQKHSETAKRLWRDPEYRQRMEAKQARRPRAKNGTFLPKNAITNLE